MEKHVPIYKEALALIEEFNQSESLLKHAYQVDGAMRYFARTMGEDEEKWGIIGLVHDLDYERFPGLHCKKHKKF
jgi:predicted hydrolase (HD superfamily)